MVTVAIEFGSLYTYTAVDTNARLPLSELSRGAKHVHGELVIRFDGKTLPSLGYIGDDDVCFNTWLQELQSVQDELAKTHEGTYVFDEGEQGQPAFKFEREEDLLYVSVIDSATSGGEADPSYQRVCCLWSEYETAFSAFKSAFRGSDRQSSG
jgi:hypothetical protein